MRPISACSPASFASSVCASPWVGSPSIVDTSALNLAGPALYGTYGVADYAVDSSPAAKAFGDAYMAAFKKSPDNQSSWAYDAINILAMAIGTANSTEPGKIRDRGHCHQRLQGRRGRI